MNTPRIASGYTTRANYHAQYRESHREQINAKKRAWREARKALRIYPFCHDNSSTTPCQYCGETPTPIERGSEETGQ